jgi:3-deoxy-7-phosphoheptulonate synthase
MLVVMQEGATEAQTESVISRLVEMGFTVHRSSGVRHTVLGGVGPVDDFDPASFEVLDGVKECHRIVSPYKLASRHFKPQGSVIKIGDVEIGGPKVISMAGPCSVESEDGIELAAKIVSSAGAQVIRGGAFKPRSSPYSFQGMGERGLQIMRAAADRHRLLVISEVMDQTQIPLLVEYSDILQVGARNMQNFALLRRLGKLRQPVLLKRNPAATVNEWLLAAEYILAGGNDQVVLCERGIRSYDPELRNTFDIGGMVLAKTLTHLPVIADPSHATGRRDLVPAVSRAALAAGADGLIVEVHPQPEEALSDGAQSLDPAGFATMMRSLQPLIAEESPVRAAASL